MARFRKSTSRKKQDCCRTGKKSYGAGIPFPAGRGILPEIRSFSVHEVGMFLEYESREENIIKFQARFSQGKT
jgi:hypothetical protein